MQGFYCSYDCRIQIIIFNFKIDYSEIYRSIVSDVLHVVAIIFLHKNAYYFELNIFPCVFSNSKFKKNEFV